VRCGINLRGDLARLGDDELLRDEIRRRVKSTAAKIGP